MSAFCVLVAALLALLIGGILKSFLDQLRYYMLIVGFLTGLHICVVNIELHS